MYVYIYIYLIWTWGTPTNSHSYGKHDENRLELGQYPISRQTHLVCDSLWLILETIQDFLGIQGMYRECCGIAIIKWTLTTKKSIKLVRWSENTCVCHQVWVAISYNEAFHSVPIIQIPYEVFQSAVRRHLCKQSKRIKKDQKVARAHLWRVSLHTVLHLFQT